MAGRWHCCQRCSVGLSGIVASGRSWSARFTVWAVVSSWSAVNVASVRGSHAKHNGMVSAHVVATLPAAWCSRVQLVRLSRFRGGIVASRNQSAAGLPWHKSALVDLPKMFRYTAT
jgi:hypothetical protein